MSYTEWYCSSLGLQSLVDMDPIRLAENAAMTRNNTLNIEHARDLGIEEDVLEEWFYGLELAGHEAAPHYNIPDYPSVQCNPVEAAKELDRLTAAGKIYWFDFDAVPADLDIGPTTPILMGTRARLVHDWTRAGLNQHLVSPATNFHTMDDFVNTLRPSAHMAGLDIRDCFFHWPIAEGSRRRLGARHPVTGQAGVYLFLPPGLSAAPGHNERFVERAVRAASKDLQLNITRFVDDLRCTNKVALSPNEDKALLDVQLRCLKHNLERLGIQVHDKPGKVIPASTSIDWLGWKVSTTELTVELTAEKREKGLKLCMDALQRHWASQPITSKQLMSLVGFLNFITGVIKQARPYLRASYQSLAVTQVFAAWQL